LSALSRRFREELEDALALAADARDVRAHRERTSRGAESVLEARFDLGEQRFHVDVGRLFADCGRSATNSKRSRMSASISDAFLRMRSRYVGALARKERAVVLWSPCGVPFDADERRLEVVAHGVEERFHLLALGPEFGRSGATRDSSSEAYSLSRASKSDLRMPTASWERERGKRVWILGVVDHERAQRLASLEERKHAQRPARRGLPRDDGALGQRARERVERGSPVRGPRGAPRSTRSRRHRASRRLP